MILLLISGVDVLMFEQSLQRSGSKPLCLAAFLWFLIFLLIIVLFVLAPEGEIQGTVHRRLLEERVDELKVGAVLLLKQVRLAASPLLQGQFRPNRHFIVRYFHVCSSQIVIFSPSLYQREQIPQ